MTQVPSSSTGEDLGKLDSRDRVGVAGEILGALGGVAGGTAAAGTLAAAAGVTTIPVLTSTASWFGIVVVSATPVGWIVGVGLAGGFIAYGVGKFILSGGKQDQIRKDLIRRLRQKTAGRQLDAAAILDPKAMSSVIDEALEQGVIDQVMADRIVSLVAKGKLDPDLAIKRVKATLASSTMPYIRDVTQYQGRRIQKPSSY